MHDLIPDVSKNNGVINDFVSHSVIDLQPLLKWRTKSARHKNFQKNLHILLDMPCNDQSTAYVSK